jgi:hypothetical protein
MAFTERIDNRMIARKTCVLHIAFPAPRFRRSSGVGSLPHNDLYLSYALRPVSATYTLCLYRTAVRIISPRCTLHGLQNEAQPPLDIFFMHELRVSPVKVCINWTGS